MNVLLPRSGFLPQTALLYCLSVSSVVTPVVLPISILSTTQAAEAQAVLVAGRGTGKVMHRTLGVLEAMFGFGTEVLKRLPQPAQQSSLNQRQLWLVEAVRYQQYMYYRQSGGYLIPLTPQNLNVLMARVGASSNEAEFVATVMYYFGSR